MASAYPDRGEEAVEGFLLIQVNIFMGTAWLEAEEGITVFSNRPICGNQDTWKSSKLSTKRS